MSYPLKNPVTIDYDKVMSTTPQSKTLQIMPGKTVVVPRSLIAAHDEEKCTIDVPESFAIRKGLI